jgi:hypothetical protein
MSFVAFTLALAIAAIGAVGVLAPAVLLTLVAEMQSPAGLWIAAALRVVLGTALYVAAPRSRAPTTFYVLGVVTVLAGVALPFLGVARFDALLGWWIAQGASVTRLWAAAAVAFGLLVAYGVIPREAR